MPDTPRLFLLDGYALIYRAFFAMIARPLRTTKGENTSAAWGVANFLLRLREKYNPEYVGWINDAGSSFRAERYPDYKSTREKLDAELQADFDRSLERIRQILDAFHIPLVTVPGYEADDVIATLATKAAARELQSVIVSGDKDFYQLIAPHVALLNPGRGGPAGVEETWVDETNASERLGVTPAQVVDYLALVGDSSDNIPGVKGVGEKGAQKLLAEYGNLDAILSRTEEITAKRTREALLAGSDNARLSRELVTIKRDVPIELDLDMMKVSEPDFDALRRILTELEFFTLAKKLQGQGSGESAAGGPPAPATQDRVRDALVTEPQDESVGRETAATVLPAPTIAVIVVDDPAELPALVARLRQAPIVAIDTETSSDEPHNADLVGLALAAGPTEIWYVPFSHRHPTTGELDLSGSDAARPAIKNLPALTTPAAAPLRELLEDPSVPKAGHDIKYDWQVLRAAGVELRGVAYDSMLASFVLEPGRRSHEIDMLCLEHLGRSMRNYEDVAGRGKAEVPFAEVSLAEASAFCGDDAATVLALRDFFATSLEGMQVEPLLREIEMPLVEVLVDMEWEGIAIDREVFSRLDSELGGDMLRLEEQIAVLAGETLNLNSPKQLATVLFDKQQLPVVKRTKTGPSTDADVLEQLANAGHELPRLILEYRELQKLKSTYVDTLPGRVNRKTGRIHTRFNQTGAATGRLSSSEPNLQNIPVRTPRGEEIRRGFVPRHGWVFLVADYSQIELRLMAHLSGDPAFIEAFKQGGDIHRQTAALIFGVPVDAVTPEMRGRAKTINFATIYGQGPFSLSRQLGITQEEAKAFIAGYFERFAGVRAFLNVQVELARSQGYVETIFKRRRYIPEIKDRNFNMRSFGERLAQNSPLQGSAADLIKLAMIRIHQSIRDGALQSRMLLQVHDELIFEAPEPEVETMRRLVRTHMEQAAELRVPLVVDIGVGPNWLDAKR
jgi:DNA polymerase-1